MKAETLYKTTQLDGRTWHGNAVVQQGKTLRRGQTGDVRLYGGQGVHAARSPEEAAMGSRWPWRLWKVEGVVAAEEYERVGCRQLRVVCELPVELSFGPNSAAALRVIRRAETLSPAEVRGLAAAQKAASDIPPGGVRDATRDAPLDATRGTAQATARIAAQNAAWAAAWAAVGGAAADAAWAAAWRAAWIAAADAASAATVADLVGQHGLEQHHIDTLRQPWLDVIGPTWDEAEDFELATAP